MTDEFLILERVAVGYGRGVVLSDVNLSLRRGSFTGLLGAYYTGSSHSDNFNTYPPRVLPGDVILVHAGVYKDDRLRYGGGSTARGAPAHSDEKTPR